MHTNTSVHETINSSVHEGDPAACRMRNCTTRGSRSRSSTSRHVQHLVRMDGAPYTSAEGAIEKARTAADGGHPTPFFEEPLNAGRYSILKMPQSTRSRAGFP